MNKDMQKEELLEDFKKILEKNRLSIENSNMKNVVDASAGSLFSPQYKLGYGDSEKDSIEALRTLLFEPGYLKNELK